MSRSLLEIEDELDKLQAAYILEEDEVKQLHLVRKFTHLLEEATELDGVLRNAAGVTIHNWSRDD